jgi:branched-chain amino acid transport system ATP-binding protein
VNQVLDRPAAAASAQASRPYFSCRDLHAYYGESYIVQGVSFDVHESEIVALLGRNGAGKTSTLRSIARLGDPQLKRGEIWLNDQPLHKMSAWQAARRGVALVPEDRRIIGGLSVEENLKLAQIEEPVGWSIERLYQHFPRLAERRQQEAVTLSGGEQQMLAVARALARDVKLLLLDEPILHEVKALGFTTIIVEQNAIAALNLADRAIILDMGEVVFDGTAKEVLENADLRHPYALRAPPRGHRWRTGGAGSAAVA